MKTTSKCSVALSKSDLLLIKAVEHGYTADELGHITSPTGRVLKLSKNNNGYLSFMPNFGVRKERRTVLAHRFIMYYFYKEIIFTYPLVRHLNDIRYDNRLDNLALGTYHDNRADIPFDKKSNAAKKSAPLLISRSRKLTDDDVIAIRYLRDTTTMSYKDIGNAYNVAAMTAYRAITKQSWSTL